MFLKSVCPLNLVTISLNRPGGPLVVAIQHSHVLHHQELDISLSPNQFPIENTTNLTGLTYEIWEDTPTGLREDETFVVG